jgi:hypothetical protein
LSAFSDVAFRCVVTQDFPDAGLPIVSNIVLLQSDNYVNPSISMGQPGWIPLDGADARTSNTVFSGGLLWSGDYFLQWVDHVVEHNSMSRRGPQWISTGHASRARYSSTGGPCTENKNTKIHISTLASTTSTSRSITFLKKTSSQ